MARSLRFRLTLWNALAGMLTGLAILFTMREGVRRALQTDLDHLLAADIQELELQLASGSVNETRLREELDFKARSHNLQGWFIAFYASDGRRVWSSINTPAELTVTAPKSSPEFAWFERYRVQTHRLASPLDDSTQLVMGYDASVIHKQLSMIDQFAILVGGIILLVSPIVGYALAARATKTFAEFIRRAERLRPARMEERLPISGTGDELDLLAKTINGLLDRIAEFLRKHHDFLADAAHELRTPLAAIRSSAEVALASDRTEEDYHELLSDVVKECESLQVLVNQLMLLAESDADRLRINESQVPFDKLVRRSLEMFQAVAEHRGVSLEAEPLPPVLVRGNSNHLQQVLNNLLDNAIKFTAARFTTPTGHEPSETSGWVRVTLQRDDARRQVELRVSDNGMGIPPADVTRVFDRFFRVDRSRSREADAGGSGLGLSICRTIVTAHHGMIYAESDPGRLTTFRVVLPLAAAPAGAPAPSSLPVSNLVPSDASGPRILKLPDGQNLSSGASFVSHSHTPPLESASDSPSIDHRAVSLRTLEKVIQQAAELLPAQGPITAFVFLNTLQALEDIPFEIGLRRGAKLFGCEPYLIKNRYRELLAQGRISLPDLQAAVRDDLGDRAEELVTPLVNLLDLRVSMLRFPNRTGSPEELRWFVAESDALHRLLPETPVENRERFLRQTKEWIMRDVVRRGGGSSTAHDMLADLLAHHHEHALEHWTDSTWETVGLHALWRTCLQGTQMASVPAPPPERELRLRNLLVKATGRDSDLLVHEALIRFSAAFADQGFSDWSLPNREKGFYASFLALYREPGSVMDRWRAGLPQEVARLLEHDIGPLQSVYESLERFGVREEEWDDFIATTLLALRGWAGILWQMEVRGDRVPLPAPPGSLIEFLAVRLILERFAIEHIAREERLECESLVALREKLEQRLAHLDPVSLEQRAMYLFQLSQYMGWNIATLYNLKPADWVRLIAEIEAFNPLERRRAFHLAFEGHYRQAALDAFTVYCHRQPRRVEKPQFQATFCIDTREESFRRHLEEVAPRVETFGAAGFFGVAMYYRGLADANFAALCPIVVRPQHWVVEDVVYTLEESNRRRAQTRRAIGTASHQVHRGSRGVAAAAVLTAGLGVLASFPLVARVLFPRLTSRISRTAGRWVAPPRITRLRLERTAATPGPENDQIGFSVTEMADRGERMLRDIGLTTNMARLVFFFGHGSFCLNNPHKSAYDCGACSGSAGGPNARALAAMLNDPRVREILATRGLHIPRETFFIGALHNTCEDSITYYDLDLLPNTHSADIEAAKAALEEACARNAAERCRRFFSAPLDITPTAARLHVEGRAEDLAQTRPEFGNASNAVCFVGRRDRVRGLYMDRRCFMHSYDPKQDDAEHTILARILAPVVPVCSGINLQYFFSSIDSAGWGAGTKLPHNVTSLLGVMDGFQSDLRCGLPQQGVEIHEPLRLLFIVETTPEAMLSIMERNSIVGRILKNGWGQLAVLDPDSSHLQLYVNGRFVPHTLEHDSLPTVASSDAWYRGWRDHLGFARIDPSA